MRMWVNGHGAPLALQGEMPAGSLYNTGDLLVGGGPGQTHMACDIEFLRIARSTFAASETSAEELYAWEFDGPQLRDFAGRAAAGARDAGALEQQ